MVWPLCSTGFSLSGPSVLNRRGSIPDIMAQGIFLDVTLIRRSSRPFSAQCLMPSIYSCVSPDLAALTRRRYSCGMRPLRYSINVTLDGAAIIVLYPPTKTCIATPSRTFSRPMPSSLAG